VDEVRKRIFFVRLDSSHKTVSATPGMPRTWIDLQSLQPRAPLSGRQGVCPPSTTARFRPRPRRRQTQLRRRIPQKDRVGVPSRRRAGPRLDRSSPIHVRGVNSRVWASFQSCLEVLPSRRGKGDGALQQAGLKARASNQQLPEPIQPLLDGRRDVLCGGQL